MRLRPDLALPALHENASMRSHCWTLHACTAPWPSLHCMRVWPGRTAWGCGCRIACRLHRAGAWGECTMVGSGAPCISPFITLQALTPCRWQVPWGAGTVVGGMVLWLVSFAVVGFIVVPAGYKVWRYYSWYSVSHYIRLLTLL